MSTKFNKRQLPDSTVYNDEETTFQAKVLLPIATPTDDKEAITFKFYKDKREEIDTALNAKANISGQVFTGAVSAPNLSGTNTGDETTSSIQTKRPLKTIEGQSLEGVGDINLNKSDVGLGNVDNTSDLNKPISTATQTVLNALQLNKEDKSNKNIANGYAGLDSSGKINPIQLPALAITDTFVVASQAEQLALVAEVGDVAVRTDLNKSFILKVTGASTLANWQELLSPTSVDQTIIDGSTNAVSSNAVFDGLALKSNIGHTHVASQITDLSKASVGLGNVDNTSDLSKPLSTATINALATKAPISSVHNPVTIGTANGLSLATQQLSLGLASSGVTGALSGTDWNTFNGKFNTPTGITTNYLPKWNGSGFGNSSIFDNGTNIGINKSSPSAKLHIVGGSGYADNIASNSNATLKLGFADPNQIVFFGLNSNNGGASFIQSYRDSDSVPQRFIINPYGGNVGINQPVPTEQLDVVGNGKFSGTISASPATTANQVPTWGQVQAIARPYKVYTALLTQTGTNAPIATVLENTLGGTVVWSYSNIGVYGASLPISILQAKTICFISSGVVNVNIFGAGYANGSSIQISNRQPNGLYSDSLMTNVNLEIRVYN